MVIRVGVTPRIIDAEDYDEARDGLAHDWWEWFDRFGLEPVVIPNRSVDGVEFVSSLEVKALLFTGGGDVAPDQPETRRERLEAYRDDQQKNLLEWALGEEIPLLGVCRGMQSLNVYFGGELERSLASLDGAMDHVATRHGVELSTPSGWEDLNRSTEVNSYHDQGVVESGVAEDLEVFARADDGVVEGLFHPEEKIIGIQWHPERTGTDESLDEIIVEEWLK